MRLPHILIVSIILLAAILGLSRLFPDTLSAESSRMGLTQSVIIAVLLISSVVAGSRFKTSTMIHYGLTWLALILGLVLIYSLVPDVRNRLAGTLLPTKPTALEDGSIEVRAGADGHFYVDAKVADVSIRFMIDTGASDVVLTPNAAKRIGLVLAPEDFNKSYHTANGTVMGAPVVLTSITMGSIAVRDVRASVNSADMDYSLLGLSFLNETSGFEVSGDRLIIRP